MSRRQASMLRRAALAASRSPYETFRHGAVLWRGTVLNSAPNSRNWTRFWRWFRNRPEHATRHAEVNCLLGIPRRLTEGADLYVVRINRSGELRYSEPCPECVRAMKRAGIRRCYYSTGSGVACIRIDQLT